MLNEHDEIMVCSTKPSKIFQWDCKCGFTNISDADEYSHSLNKNSNERDRHITTLVMTKSYYPSFVKQLQARWRLHQNVSIK